MDVLITEEDTPSQQWLTQNTVMLIVF